jgi:hypothetical protein
MNARFPGRVSELRSPRGRFVLISVDADSTHSNGSFSANHALFVRDLRDNEKRLVYEFDRYVDVKWSPRGGKVAINDYHSSDRSSSVILLIDGQEKRIDLDDKFASEVERERSISGNHHVYMETDRWLNDNRVLLKIHGHGDVDPGGFTLWYEYSVAEDRVTKVNRK